jgi:hypothetical protein
MQIFGGVVSRKPMRKSGRRKAQRKNRRFVLVAPSALRPQECGRGSLKSRATNQTETLPKNALRRKRPHGKRFFRLETDRFAISSELLLA